MVPDVEASLGAVTTTAGVCAWLHKAMHARMTSSTTRRSHMLLDVRVTRVDSGVDAVAIKILPNDWRWGSASQCVGVEWTVARQDTKP